MNSEFSRLEKLGWEIPALLEPGLYSPKAVDENAISFPSESYDSEPTNKEADGFWASERARAVANLLHKFETRTLWEVGAGNGNVAIPLRNLGFTIFPIEPLYSGSQTLIKNGFPTFLSTLEALNLPANSIEAIGLFDVLEHLEKPEILLKEVYRVLQPGGVLLYSIPSYQWLFSDFDLAVGHYRRYSPKTLRELIGPIGFNEISISYLFGFLVIPALLLRRIPYLLGRKRTFTKVHSSNLNTSGLLTYFFSFARKICSIEAKMKVRCGLSIVGSTQKM